MAHAIAPCMTDRAPRGGWPSGFVGMLMLGLVVELALSHAVTPSHATAMWRNDRRASEGERATSAEILCVGDSLVKTGVVPAALEARLDRSTYNLATIGNPTPATYFLLRRALESGARPRALILDAQSDKLRERSFRACAAAWAGLIGPGEALDLAQVDGDPGLFGLLLIHHIVPSIRLRHELRAAISGVPLASKTDLLTDWLRMLERQERRNQGAILFPHLKPEGPRSLGDEDSPAPIGPSATVATPTNLAYLDRTLELARARGIRVFLLLTPIHPEARERLRRNSSYLALVRTVAGRFENVVVIDGRGVVEDGDVFLDASQHMDVRGATAFSRALADAIAPWLEGPKPSERWVELPPFTEPALRLSVETMDESEWAVAWQRARH